MTYPKKLIEVALPLEAINKESAREKSIRHGHPSTLHLWWARRPLAAARAVLFSSLIDDPSEYIDDEEEQKKERERLFQLIEELVKWENINNDEVLDKAKLEIARSVARNIGETMPIGKKAIEEFLATKAPPVLDPFAGGGTIPLEAQRLGLRAYASDLNPVAVLINKALIEIPPKFANMPPVHPHEEGKEQDELFKKEWKGAEGLAEDIGYYGNLLFQSVKSKIGKFYPRYKLSKDIFNIYPELKSGGYKENDDVTVLAWLWARTIECPNPACHAKMPLIRSLWISQNKKRNIWLDPVIDRNVAPPLVSFKVETKGGGPKASPKVGRGAKFRCLACNQITQENDIRNQFIQKQDGEILLAGIIDTKVGRLCVDASTFSDITIDHDEIIWTPDIPMNTKTPNLISGRGYGITKWEELFTSRQLMMLSTFTSELNTIKNKVLIDVHNREIGTSDDFRSLAEGGVGGNAYAEAITVYLGESISKLTTFHNKLAYWRTKEMKSASGFGRQALAMTWDFTEINPFAEASGDFRQIATDALPKVIATVIPSTLKGKVSQIDAMEGDYPIQSPMISTDPPYYDNVDYSNLSDFFYVWLREMLKDIFPTIFGTLLTPKENELVAASFRFNGNSSQAKDFFEAGFLKVFQNLFVLSSQKFPLTFFYAFKQTETNEELRSSTGWETMLEGLIKSGFEIVGTWPMRTENPTRALATSSGGTNALNSSIILVCRKNNKEITQISRRDFQAKLRSSLPNAVQKMQQGSIAPVDLAEASIGPGMAIFSRYKQILEADGSPMTIRSALSLINQILDEALSEQEGNYDNNTRWAIVWYEQFRNEQGVFGIAETLSKAKNTSIQSLVEAGILESRSGHVRLLRRDELDENLTPEKDKQLTIWEATQYLIRTLDKKGEQAAAELLKRLGAKAEPARDLAYRLYTICERKSWAQDALGYNMLVVAWPRLKELESKISSETQTSFL